MGTPVQQEVQPRHRFFGWLKNAQRVRHCQEFMAMFMGKWWINILKTNGFEIFEGIFRPQGVSEIFRNHENADLDHPGPTKNPTGKSHEVTHNRWISKLQVAKWFSISNHFVLARLFVVNKPGAPCKTSRPTSRGVPASFGRSKNLPQGQLTKRCDVYSTPWECRTSAHGFLGVHYKSQWLMFTISLLIGLPPQVGSIPHSLGTIEVCREDTSQLGTFQPQSGTRLPAYLGDCGHIFVSWRNPKWGNGSKHLGKAKPLDVSISEWCQWIKRESQPETLACHPCSHHPSLWHVEWMMFRCIA